MKLTLLNSYEYDKLHNVLNFVLKFFQVKFTNRKLKESIDLHIDTPSLSTVKDILSDYGIQSTVIRKGNYSFEDFETPFICLIKKEDWLESSFTVITKVEEGIVNFLDTYTNKIDSLTIEKFEKIDEKIILLMDDTDKKNEDNYDVNKKTGIINKWSVLFPLLIIIGLMLYSFIFRNNYGEENEIQKTLYLLTFCAGSLFAALLIWQEVDSENPFFRKVCGGSKGSKTNCNQVLSSKGSKFLGISWSIWGASYFLTLFISHLLLFNTITTILCGLASILVSPYIFYSIYYQFKIVKKWCALCLMVQGVLAVNFLLSLFLTFNFTANFYWGITLTILLTGILIVFLIMYLISLLKKTRRGKLVEKKWRKLRYNQNVFRALLEQEPKMQSADSVGILIGNPDATIEIVKVCNPFCGPCAIAHKEIIKLLARNKHIKVRIIFNPGGEKDANTLPVLHFLGIAEELGEEKFHQALDYWFLSETKNYKDLVSKYPVEENLTKYFSRARMLSEWCQKMNVNSTPTFFINGHQLSTEYNFTDFKYLF